MFAITAAITLAALGGAGQAVLVDFYADWCGPCRAMDPVVRELAAQGYPVRQVNVDRERALAQQFRVRGVPCFVMLVDGREVSRLEGATSRERLVQMIRQAVPRSQPPVVLASAAQAPAVTLPAAPSPGALCPVPGSGQQAAAPPAVAIPAVAVPAVGPVVAAQVAAPPASPAAAEAPRGPMRSEADLIAATVRLRIEDPQGRSCGSGTIIDTRQGEALILTCGHIFRDSQGKGRIDVDLFGPTPATGIPGQLISYDLQRDVALLTIHVPGPVVALPVAPPTRGPRVGDVAVTVGCDHGADPTARRTQVTAIGKYLGPPNLQVDDVPVVGRSGGGLFAADGSVIGVCNAADPTVQKGLYAAVGSVYAELDRAGLAYLYRDQAQVPPVAVARADPPEMPKQMPRPAEVQPTTAQTPQASPTAAMPLTKDEQAMLDDIQRRLGQGDEVICIVRKRDDPQGKSAVYMLDRASEAVLERLSAAAKK